MEPLKKKMVINVVISTNTVFTLEILHSVRYGTVRCGAVRVCLHCSAQFRIPSNKRGGAQMKIRMRESNELRTPVLAPS